MNDRDKRRPISAALRAVFDNNWFYVACIELWGVYVHLPLPQLPLYLYLPPLFLFCYAVFFAWELARGRRLDRARGDACVRPDPAAERGNAREEPWGTERADHLYGSEPEERTVGELSGPEPEKQISGRDFVNGLARVLTSKSSYLIAAVCALPPYWLAEYYYDGYPFAIVVKGAVTLLSFALTFAFLAYEKAGKRK